MNTTVAVQTHIYMKICDRCGHKAPEFNEQGGHNFCPASEEGKIIILCMKCKVVDANKHSEWAVNLPAGS